MIGNLISAQRSRLIMLAILLMALMAPFLVPQPAHATTAMGSWWTNHSRCTNVAGSYIDSQGQYRNFLSGGGIPQVELTALAVTQSGYGSARLVKYTVSEYEDGVWQQTKSSGTVSIALPVTITPLWMYDLVNTAPRGNYAKYQVWLSNGAFCQGQWNIGQ